MFDRVAGEIRLFSGTFEIEGWLFCDGRKLPIAMYSKLHRALGTTFGGDGSTFKLPDLRGRMPELNFQVCTDGEVPSESHASFSGSAFTGEIRPFAFDYEPVGWRRCDGSVLPISGNVALYSICGERFGAATPGRTFALPNLLHTGVNYCIALDQYFPARS